MTDSTYAQKIGRQVRARRTLLGLNQVEIADLAGTTQRTVSLVEAGKASGLELYASVAAVLGLELVCLPRDRADSHQAPPR